MKFDNWYNKEWLPNARALTHQMATMSRFLSKNTPTHETIDALADKFVNMKNTMREVEVALTKLEQKKVL